MMLELLTPDQLLLLGASLGALGLSFAILVGAGVAAGLNRLSPPPDVPPWQPQLPLLEHFLKIANHGPADDPPAFRMKALTDHITAAVAQGKET